MLNSQPVGLTFAVRPGMILAGALALVSLGCSGGLASRWADFETNRAIESAAADDSFPSAAEAGVAIGGEAAKVAKRDSGEAPQLKSDPAEDEE